MTFSHANSASATCKIKNLNSAGLTDDFLTMSLNQSSGSGVKLTGGTDPETASSESSTPTAPDDTNIGSTADSKEGSSSELLKELQNYRPSTGTKSDSASGVLANNVTEEADAFNTDALDDILDEILIDITDGVHTSDTTCCNASDASMVDETEFFGVDLDLEGIYNPFVPVVTPANNVLNEMFNELLDDLVTAPSTNVGLNVSKADIGVNGKTFNESNDSDSSSDDDIFEKSFNNTTLNESNDCLLSDELPVPKDVANEFIYNSNFDDFGYNPLLDGQVAYEDDTAFDNVEDEIARFISEYESSYKEEQDLEKMVSLKTTRNFKPKTFNIQKKKSCIIKPETSKITKPKKGSIIISVKKPKLIEPNPQNSKLTSFYEKISNFWNTILVNLPWRNSNEKDNSKCASVSLPNIKEDFGIVTFESLFLNNNKNIKDEHNLANNNNINNKNYYSYKSREKKISSTEQKIIEKSFKNNKNNIRKEKIHKPKHTKHQLKYSYMDHHKYSNPKNGKRVETIMQDLII